MTDDYDDLPWECHVLSSDPIPFDGPTVHPTHAPTANPTNTPSDMPTTPPTHAPTANPTDLPTSHPTDVPTSPPTDAPAESCDAAASEGACESIIYDFGDAICTFLPYVRKGTGLCPNKKSSCCVTRSGTSLACKRIGADLKVDNVNECDAHCHGPSGVMAGCVNARYDRKKKMCRLCSSVKKAVAHTAQHEGNDRFVALAPEREASSKAMPTSVVLAVVAPISILGCIAAFAAGRRSRASANDENAEPDQDEVDCGTQGGVSLGKGTFTKQHRLPDVVADTTDV